MASRSYLYSIDKIPTDISSQVFDRRWLTESNYDIPLSHQILVSSNTRFCKSTIWESNKEISLIWDFKWWVEKLKLFFDLLRKKEICDRDEFFSLYVDTLEFLENIENQNNFILLEPYEVLDLEEDPDQSLQELFEDIELLQDEENLDKIAEDIKDDWKEILDISFWSNTLYY